ncbi:protein LEAD-SENSITIVE 1-like [Aristolochia californica]|uniref:protein LEAD-SENSITIVE 1-like n=1 Tax=Aristolochia californica TaxID=171875 RepID=UPI0035DA7F19
MGFLSNKVERDQIKAGDHIYSWRAIYAYSHHGIYVGGSKVVHFRRKKDMTSLTGTSIDSSGSSSEKSLSICEIFPDCGFSLPDSGVVLTCLDCFLDGGSLYCFEYGAAPSIFLAKLRGGTCTTAESDPPETVVHRAMYLLQKGFGNYDVFQNNCEDFALYCKTGLLVLDKSGTGMSGQASSFMGVPVAALVSSPLKLLIPGPVGVATVTAGMYCMSRYATDIGVRTDVVKVPVEEMATSLSLAETEQDSSEEEDTEEKAQSKEPPQKKSR